MSQPLSDSPSHGLVASHVSVTDRAGHVIVDDVSVHARPGRTLVIVGESGAGKSMLARTLCALTPSALSASGTVSLGGEDYDLATNQGRLKKQRGGGIVWLPQDPFTSLAPTIRCAKQVTAARTGRRSERAQRSRALLAEVGLDARVARSYPHELSGGMRQRVAIAAALDSEPGVLIADEPTTALDVTTQRDILTLLTRLRDDRGMTLVLVTHDLALARQFGDDVIVMKDGQIVEEGPINEVLVSPRHEYTKRLADAEPRIDGPSPRAGHEPHVGAEAVVEVRDLTKVFRSRTDTRVALRDVSLNVAQGESIGIVGESGSGKTTLARIIVGLEHADSDTVRVNAQAERGPAVGIVFQTPTRPSTLRAPSARHSPRQPPSPVDRPAMFPTCSPPSTCPPSMRCAVLSACRAANASAWQSRVPSPRARASSSPTRPSPPSTSPSRPPSWSYSRACKPSKASPCSSSRTTWRSPEPCATASSS